MFSLFRKSKRVVGLDIKADHIRFSEILKTSDEDRITAYGEIIPETAIFENGNIVNEKALFTYLKEMKKNLRTNDCVVSLPEDQVKYLRLSLHKTKPSRARDEISAFLQAKEVITFEEDILYFERKGENKEHFEYDVLIAKRALIRKYREIFHALHFKVKRFMTPGQALIASTVPKEGTTSFLIASVDEVVANIAIDSVGHPPIFYHGAATNHSIISNLNRIYIDWYDEHKEKVDHVLFAGSRAKDADFLDYVSRETRIPITRANIFINLRLDGQKIPIITKDDSYKYAVAVGLAIS